MGHSMGGHAALLYSMKSRHSIAACVASCPVCDLPYQYTERVDVPRTMHSAFGSYDNIDEHLREHSPLHQVQAMRDIPYLIVHGMLDGVVKKTSHSDPLVSAMRKRNLNVEYIECPKMGHGHPMDYPTSRKVADFVIANLKC
jgi:dipeptidyl aminopeptidase/acylaminoacyl peptidase